jgi:addiction module HigA family antidote
MYSRILAKHCASCASKPYLTPAQALRVSRKTLSSIVNGRAGISAEMAVRLSIAFDTTAESWLNQQVQYDLWLAEQQRKRLRVKRLSAA